MNKLFPLIQKELRYFTNSAVAYVIGVFFLVFTSLWLFNFNNFVANDVATLQPYFFIFQILFILIVPALTMRTWAEEHRQGTLEILMTLPYSEWKLVAAKFLSPLILLALLLFLTLPVPISVSFLGRFDAGTIIGQYVGMFLLGASQIAIGMYISSLTRHQVTAFLVTAAVLLILMFLDLLSAIGVLPNWLASFVNYLSSRLHTESFVKGLIDTRDVFYFGALTFLFLFLNERNLVIRKWR